MVKDKETFIIKMGKLLQENNHSKKSGKKAPRISPEIKSKFLQALQTQPCIKRAAEKFGINYSTAKTIIHANQKYFDDKKGEIDPEQYIPNQWVLLKTFRSSRKKKI